MTIGVLKRDATGPLVRKWQTFLRGQGFPIIVSGIFDAETVKATRSFQTKYGLELDGKVGNETFGQAMLLGFEMVDFTSEPKSGWPKEPGFRPLTSAARQTMFGRFSFIADPQPDNPEQIRITDDWEADNIVSATVPQLAGVKGVNRNGVVRFHRLAVEQLLGLWEVWDKAGLLDRVLTYEGAYNPRFVRGSDKVLSNHAFGTAFDINYSWNKFGAEPAWPGQKGCLFELVPIAHKSGFYWGGHFRRRDGMHFEVAKLL